jgi:hypothetical protein
MVSAVLFSRGRRTVRLYLLDEDRRVFLDAEG